MSIGSVGAPRTTQTQTTLSAEAAAVAAQRRADQQKAVADEQAKVDAEKLAADLADLTKEQQLSMTMTGTRHIDVYA
jgi:hypothetical protein